MTSPSTPGSTTAEPTAESTAAEPSGCGCATTTSETPAPAPSASTSPCCGTQEAADVAGACCDPTAKSAALTAGASCCG
ncbi:MAG TPA: hypothetical protein VHN80_14275 [Kineosporiaceae bacterium]|jgi:hypothetical protein|nr:hypothetical protein [Kineosporiaceae bacterium]